MPETKFKNKATPAQARDLLYRIKEYTKVQGCDRALAELSDPEGIFGVYANIYTFALNSSGTQLVNARHPELVGRNFSNQADADGKLFMEELLESSKTVVGCKSVEFRWMSKESKTVGTRLLFHENIDYGNRGEVIACLYFVASES